MISFFVSTVTSDEQSHLLFKSIIHIIYTFNRFPNWNSEELATADLILQDFTVLLVWWTDRVDALAGVQTRLCSVSEITEDLEGVSGAALVGVNPVISCRGRQRDKTQHKNSESSYDWVYKKNPYMFFSSLCNVNAIIFKSNNLYYCQ